MKILLFLLLPLSLAAENNAPTAKNALITAINPTNTSPNSVKWGTTGHRVIGEVATAYLRRRTKKRIQEILGPESIAISSNWADFIKSDTSMNYIGPWHYINVKGGMNNADFTAYLQNDTAVDAYTKIIFLTTQLKNKQLPMKEKQMYLRLLIHLVGDIHQPMHVSHAEDQGGNKIRVSWFNEPTNLHALWDDKLVDFQKLSYTEFTQNINHVSKEQRLEWQKQPLSEWFFESYQLADKVYSSITQADQKLSYRYNYDYIEIVNRQLLKGGVRLAGLLNEIFS
jgi:S1/P1 Nuclease